MARSGGKPGAQTARAAHRSISTKTLRAGLRACKSGVSNSGRPLLPGPESSGFKRSPDLAYRCGGSVGIASSWAERRAPTSRFTRPVRTDHLAPSVCGRSIRALAAFHGLAQPAGRSSSHEAGDGRPGDVMNTAVVEARQGQGDLKARNWLSRPCWPWPCATAPSSRYASDCQ